MDNYVPRYQSAGLGRHSLSNTRHVINDIFRRILVREVAVFVIAKPDLRL